MEDEDCILLIDENNVAGHQKLFKNTIALILFSFCLMYPGPRYPFINVPVL